MPKFSVKNVNGVFVEVFPDQLRVKNEYGQWVAPRKAYVKAETGLFVDTGYTTSPNAPVSFKVSSSNLSSVTTTWSAPEAASGVTAPSGYEVAIRDVNGAAISGMPDRAASGGTTTWTGLSQDTKYQFFVRSVTAAKLVSGWVGLRHAIGHAAQTAERTVSKTREWRSAKLMVGLTNQEIAGQTAPTSVYVTDIELEIWTPYGWTNMSGLGREIFHMGNGAADINGVMQPFGAWGLSFGPSWVASPFRYRQSNGGAWGIWLSGSGYDHKYGAYEPIYANIVLAGTETYSQTETYTSVAAQANYDW